MARLGLRALPALLHPDGERARRRGRRSVPRPCRPARTRARAGDQPAVRGLLRRRRAGRIPAHRRCERLPAGGFRRLRQEHPARPAAVGGARLPASGASTGRTCGYAPGRWSAACCSSAAGRSGCVTAIEVDRSSRLGPAPSCWPAGRSIPRNCCNFPVSGTPRSWLRSASRWCTSCPAWVPTCRITWRSTSSTPAGNRSPCSATSNTGTGRGSALSGCWLGSGPGATNHFEGGGFLRSNDQVDYPEPDVSLPADRGALRRLRARRWCGQAGEAGGVSGAHRPDVFRLPRLGENHLGRPAGAPGVAVQLPVHRPGPPGMGGSGQDRARRFSTSRRLAAFNGGEMSPGPAVATDQRDPGLGAPRWRDRAAPVRAPPGSASARTRWSTRSAWRCTACRGLCVVDASVMPYVTNGTSTHR